MPRHLAKLLLFVLLQAGLYGTLRHVASQEDGSEAKAALAMAASLPAESSPGEPVVTATGQEEDLPAFLRKRLYDEWRSSPAIIDQMLQGNGSAAAVARLGWEYLNGPQHYMRALIDKEQRLRTAAGPRVMMIGGSNVFLSTDSQLLQERYGRAVINMGLTAPLGSRFMINQIAPYVRKGDVVLVVFEHGLMSFPTEGLPAATQLVRENAPEVAAYLDGTELPALTGGQPASQMVSAAQANATVAISQRLREAKGYADTEALADLAIHIRGLADRSRGRLLLAPLAGVPVIDGEESQESAAGMESAALPTVADTRSEKPPQAESVTAAEAESGSVADFDRAVQPLLDALARWPRLGDAVSRLGVNEYGDMTTHWGRGPLHSEYKLSPEICHPDPAAFEANVLLLNRLADHCRAVGAEIYFVQPPLLRTADSVKSAEPYEKMLQDRLSFPVIFPIRDSFVTEAELFDTNYHLNWSGITRRMGILCTHLDNYLPVRYPRSIEEHIAHRDREVRGTVQFAERLKLPAAAPLRTAAEIAGSAIR